MPALELLALRKGAQIKLNTNHKMYKIPNDQVPNAGGPAKFCLMRRA